MTWRLRHHPIVFEFVFFRAPSLKYFCPNLLDGLNNKVSVKTWVINFQLELYPKTELLRMCFFLKRLQNGKLRGSLARFPLSFHLRQDNNSFYVRALRFVHKSWTAATQFSRIVLNHRVSSVVSDNVVNSLT